MEELYAFVESYIREEFDQEAVLKETSRGTISRIRQKNSHRRYICRRCGGSARIYESLLGKKSRHLPQIFEAASRGHETGLGNRTAEYIVLEEYIMGDTLAMLMQGGPIPPKTVRRISLQICSGLYVLHSLGWVHRDIKPENVMIRGDDAVLIDFDAARSFSQGRGNAGENVKTQDTRILGTVGYAPPEQYGISETDYRADIYAMGVLMNEMLTGVHPSQTLAEGRWGRIISRCTMIQPDKRYNSVTELMEAL